SLGDVLDRQEANAAKVTAVCPMWLPRNFAQERTMPSFVFESLLWWGLPLVGLPVLIHLINLMRHRRVEWAAMEFLLQSQKRHRKSVLFKQLLLLLLRMAAI